MNAAVVRCTRITIAAFCSLLVFGAGAARAQGGAAVAEPSLRDELLTMFEADQAAQQAVIRSEDDSDAARRVAALNAQHLARLKDIIVKHGWPGYALVGEDGAHAAWLLVQHMDADPAFQKRCLALLVDAVADDNASGRDLAYLTDRVRVADGRLQVYGTQFRKEGEFMALAPVENPEGLNERRASVGLPPMDEYYRMMRDTYPGIRLKTNSN